MPELTAFRKEASLSMRNVSAIKDNALVRWIFQPRRVPLLFSVTVVAGIFYHYAPKFTLLFIVLSLLIQAVLFRLFDFVKAHPLLGGAAYGAVGMAFLGLSLVMMRLGYDSAVFAPDDLTLRINFFVWFMTPQSVLVTDYVGYTIALFLLFTYFIASVAYYFTFVRYRVLMSFLVMLFPFAIYAKENENMPVPSIIILLICYFAVMIYCRQAHAEDAEVVQIYAPNAESRLRIPSKKSSYADVKPEILDGTFLHAAGMFLAAAGILVLVIPKPTVVADRTFLDTMLDLSSLSNYLENAIRGFADTSDGGSYTPQNYNRALYYAAADEPMNLRVRSFTNYHYADHSWEASEYDTAPEQTDYRYVKMDGFETISPEADAGDLALLIRKIALADAEFSRKWKLAEFANTDFDPAQYDHEMDVTSATFNTFVYPCPNHLNRVLITDYYDKQVPSYVNASGILFRYSQYRSYNEKYTIGYQSEHMAETRAEQLLFQSVNTGNYAEFLLDLQSRVTDAADKALVQTAIDAYLAAQQYAASVVSETPDSVRALAEQLTAGKTSDYDKALAIRDYLKFTDFIYSKEYLITDANNVETFLFNEKTGVCYQFASAMAELCRAAGLYTRYVEGYAMSELDDRLFRNEAVYVISTEHAHAFVDVYIAGYGWLMLDATAGSILETPVSNRVNIVATLQFSGLILLGAAILLLMVLGWLIPMLREKLFRRRYRQMMDAQAVQEAFARLRKQWHADPAETARVLCTEKAQFLGVDLSELLSGFEETLYADRCTRETAERVYRAYCAAYDAWKPACRRERKERRAAEKALRRQQKAAQA